MQYHEDLKLATARLSAEWSSPSCDPDRTKDLVAEVLAAAESGIESRVNDSGYDTRTGDIADTLIECSREPKDRM